MPLRSMFEFNYPSVKELPVICRVEPLDDLYMFFLNGAYLGDFIFKDDKAVWQQQSGEPLDEEMIGTIALIIQAHYSPEA